MDFWLGVAAGAFGLSMVSGLILLALTLTDRSDDTPYRAWDDVLEENRELRRENDWLREMWGTEQ